MTDRRDHRHRTIDNRPYNIGMIELSRIAAAAMNDHNRSSLITDRLQRTHNIFDVPDADKDVRHHTKLRHSELGTKISPSSRLMTANDEHPLNVRRHTRRELIHIHDVRGARHQLRESPHAPIVADHLLGVFIS